MTWTLLFTILAIWTAGSIVLGIVIGRIFRNIRHQDNAYWHQIKLQSQWRYKNAQAIVSRSRDLSLHRGQNDTQSISEMAINLSHHSYNPDQDLSA